jgi:hypothetical protein
MESGNGKKIEANSDFTSLFPSVENRSFGRLPAKGRKSSQIISSDGLFFSGGPVPQILSGREGTMRFRPKRDTSVYRGAMAWGRLDGKLAVHQL